MVLMKGLNLYKELKKPSTYGPDIKSVDILQTHISFVVLTGKFAYKIKKPVDFGFLDFSTIEKRKYFCEEEVRLNRRLCPDIYLDVIPITKKDRILELNGDGEIVDYALKMREFPQDKIMTNLLYEKDGKIGILQINRPDKLNALNNETIKALYDALEQVNADPEIMVLIITGVGEKAFVAGADINEVKERDAIIGRDDTRNRQKDGSSPYPRA